MDWAILLVSAATLIATIGYGWASSRLQREETSRTLERADVHWRVDRLDPQTFQIQHDGRDPAFDVSVAIEINGELHHCEQDRVDRDGTIEIRSATALEEHLKADRERRAYKAHPTAETHSWGISLPAPFPMIRFVSVSGRITWRSAGGKWDAQQVAEKESARFG